MLKEELKEIWRNAGCVCFDVDSTVCVNEAIDDLAIFAGVGDEVQRLTLEAMGGNMTFREALHKRLAIIKPSAKMIEDFNREQPNQLTPGIKELIELLHTKEIPVYLVSGGFRVFINPVADLLNISHSNVFANSLIFDEHGNYVEFDTNEPTSESGGKARVIEQLMKKKGYKNVIMIGDGATDLESCPPADGFIGFGGNVVRERVKKASAWFVMSFQELIDELQ